MLFFITICPSSWHTIHYQLYKYAFNNTSQLTQYNTSLFTHSLTHSLTHFRLYTLMEKALLRKHYAYSKIDEEDPEEIKHRRAQFLIQKILLQVDNRRKPSFLRIRMCKLKVRIGRRLKKLRKSMLLGVSVARVRLYKQIISRMKTWRRLFHRVGGEPLVSLAPMFAWSFCPSFFLLFVCQEYVLASGTCYFIMWSNGCAALIRLCLLESWKEWFTFQRCWRRLWES